jgi:hypothetical protein
VRTWRNSRALKVFLEAGFTGDSIFIQNLFSDYPILRSRIATFHASVANHGVKVSSHQLFGIHAKAFYYDNQRPGLLIQHLCRLFLINNPNPTRELRWSFSLLLHDHNLPSPFSEQDGRKN